MKNKKIMIVFALIGILAITVGVTYSFFVYIREGLTENTITTGTIKFIYDEKTGYGNGIGITDAVPISDELGKAQVGDGKVFNFKVVSTTMKKVAIPYSITVKKYNSTLDDKLVKIYLARVDGEVETELITSNYSETIEEGVVVKEGLENYKANEKLLYTGRVPSNTSSYEENYRLKMWIDEDANFSPIDESGESPYNGQTFQIKVNVYAEGNSIDDTELAKEGEARLNGMSIGGSPLTASATDNKLYETTLPEGTTSTTIDLDTSEYAKVKVEKTDSNYNVVTSMNPNSSIQRMSTRLTLPLESGENYFKITVTSLDKEATNTYKLHISIIESIKIFGKVYEVNTATPTLTTTAEVANENGLYKSTETNSGDPTYYFRGAVDNNWVSFVGQLWRIVRINEDGSIRLIMQNGINSNTKYTLAGNQNLYYYSDGTVAGTAKYEVEKWYNENIDIYINGTNGPKYSDNVVAGDYCEQAKVMSEVPVFNHGIENTEMVGVSKYVPNYRCEVDGNSHGLLQSNSMNPGPYVGLITYDEVAMAGGIYNNGYGASNFYLKNNYDFYTMSSAGKACYNSCWSWLWMVSSTGSLDLGYVYSPPNNKYTVRPVINLDKDTTIQKGTGTSGDPFLITSSPEI